MRERGEGISEGERRVSSGEGKGKGKSEGEGGGD